MRQLIQLVLSIIFLSVINADLSLARSSSFQISSSLNEFQDPGASREIKVLQPHIRRKRGAIGALAKGLTALSWGSYGVSVGSTLYHAIRNCKDYRPKPCKQPTCHYLSPCPNFLCQNVEKNKDYIETEKKKMQAQLKHIDILVVRALRLELDGKSANIYNQRILNYINAINRNFDRLIDGIVRVDSGISEKFKNRSLEILAMVNDKRTSVHQIIASPLVQGIFDKWTWDGTGRFVFSLALTLGYGIFGQLKERYAINKIYKEMKADFNKKFLAQKTSANKFANVLGLTTKGIRTQIRNAAKAVHKSNKADKTQGIVSKAIGPLVNGLYTALSAWSVYTQVIKCQKATNDMQETAINATETRDEIEKIKVTDVQPLFRQIYVQTWKPVYDLINNNMIRDLLEGIKVLTVEAQFADTRPAQTVTNFLANTGSVNSFTSPTRTRFLQRGLIAALITIEFRFRCIADKQHAISIVINDCKSGRNTLNTLHSEAESTYDLNTRSCVDKKIIPYTSQAELQNIISKVAKQKGWYGNCLLNDKDLLYRVCSERAKGYIRPVDIVSQLNKPDLTQNMVSNFLTRCPRPEITPKNTADTCKYYCLYQTSQQIAKLLGLLESQVKTIVPSCGICTVTVKEKTQICYLHFCKGTNASKIEPMVELPLPTVNNVISGCTQKCELEYSEKEQICQQLKCKQYSSNTVASSFNLPVATIEELKPQCDSIVMKCKISDQDKKFILILHCLRQVPATTLQNYVGLPLKDVEGVIKSQTCDDYLKNGLKS